MSIYFTVGWILNMVAMLTSWQKQGPFKEHGDEMLIKAVCVPRNNREVGLSFAYLICKTTRWIF
jgi:hypothetical protein